MSDRRCAIVGIDLSMTSTGAACIQIRNSEPAKMQAAAVNLARIQTKPTAHVVAARSLRLRSIAGQVFTLCESADLVVVEGPSYGSTGGAAHDRSGLWWLVCARLTGQGIPVVEVVPSVVKMYATGKGNAAKDQVLAAVIRRYHWLDVDGNDVADALVLAAMGARALGYPIEADGLPMQHTRAMRTPAWPTQPKE